MVKKAPRQTRRRRKTILEELSGSGLSPGNVSEEELKTRMPESDDTKSGFRADTAIEVSLPSKPPILETESLTHAKKQEEFHIPTTLHTNGEPDYKKWLRNQVSSIRQRPLSANR